MKKLTSIALVLLIATPVLAYVIYCPTGLPLVSQYSNDSWQSNNAQGIAMTAYETRDYWVKEVRDAKKIVDEYTLKHRDMKDLVINHLQLGPHFPTEGTCIGCYDYQINMQFWTDKLGGAIADWEIAKIEYYDAHEAFMLKANIWEMWASTADRSLAAYRGHTCHPDYEQTCPDCEKTHSNP